MLCVKDMEYSELEESIPKYILAQKYSAQKIIKKVS